MSAEADNAMTISNHKAIISYDPETDRLRGEFIGLHGGAKMRKQLLANFLYKFVEHSLARARVLLRKRRQFTKKP